jgi:hypothetical protein
MAHQGDGRQRTDGKQAPRPVPSGSQRTDRAQRRLVLLLNDAGSAVE